MAQVVAEVTWWDSSDAPSTEGLKVAGEHPAAAAQVTWWDSSDAPSADGLKVVGEQPAAAASATPRRARRASTSPATPTSPKISTSPPPVTHVPVPLVAWPSLYGGSMVPAAQASGAVAPLGTPRRQATNLVHRYRYIDTEV